MTQRPPVWQIVREAIEHLGSPTTHAAIREFVSDKYPGVKPNTLSSQINVCSVNSPSRVHYPENEKPRLCESQYDFLYRTGRGEVVRYDPNVHGKWEIRVNEFGKLVAAQVLGDDEGDEERDAGGDEFSFALESHLRDFLAKNISTIPVDGAKLQLYRDEDNSSGVEYQTSVGRIDLLAQDSRGNFVVIELKVQRGSDQVVGQAMRYMGWVKKHLAKDKAVTALIVACEIDEKLKYAASMSPNIKLLEYKLRFDLSPVALA